MKNNDFFKPTVAHLDEHPFSDKLLQLFRSENISIKSEVDES